MFRKERTAVADESSTAVAAKVSGTPGQTWAGGPPKYGSTTILPTRTATSTPNRARPHPAATSSRCFRSRSEHSAAATKPAVTQKGGVPGPPGESMSSSPGEAASPGGLTPASSSHSEGCSTSSGVHGMSRRAGRPSPIATLT